MKVLSTITDPVYQPKNHLSAYDRFWLKYMNDKRDLPFIHLLTGIHLLVIPAAIILYTNLLSGWTWWALAIPYFYVSQMYYKGRFGLMYHCMCHRKTFIKPYQGYFHNYITWFVTPFFGHTPETYFSHHMGMHHVENNTEDDDSSTMPYQRDSIRGFLMYYMDFMVSGFKDTFAYLYKRKRRKLYSRLSFGEVCFFLFCIGMSFVNLPATLLVFIIPFFFGRLVMMLGNWTQHAFVDHEEPTNLYKSAINCINTSYNKICWNDGYHIIHHLRPGLHYTEMPLEFIRLKESFARNKALVFDGVHYLHVFFYLMTKRYDKLAEHVVNIDNMFSSREDAIQLMKQRTRKIKPASIST